MSTAAAAARPILSPLAHGIVDVARTSLQSRVSRLDNARYHGGPRSHPVSYVVWHCTAGDRAQDGIAWLNRPGVPGAQRASYHYVIDIDGLIFRTLPPELVAYHAGRSAWPLPDPSLPDGGVTASDSINRVSIGVSYANDNGSDGDERDDPLTEPQLESGLWLARVLSETYRLGAGAHIGHRECAPGRKTDPLPRILDMDEWRAAIACVMGPA